DGGIRDESRPVARIAEAPDRSGEGVLDFILPWNGAAIDEIGHRIIAVDGETAAVVDHHQLGGRRPSPRLGEEPAQAESREADGERQRGKMHAPAPCCGHSLADHPANQHNAPAVNLRYTLYAPS